MAQQQQKRFLRFRHAAIKRYGDKKWTACDGYIEFNPNYTVSCSSAEAGDFDTADDRALVVELSNGTKFLCFVHDFGGYPEDEVLSAKGEEANRYAGEACYLNVKQNINKLNKQYYVR